MSRTSSTCATGRRSTSPTSSSSSGSQPFSERSPAPIGRSTGRVAVATLRFRAPEAGRLDRALAGRPEVGSRALAERLISGGAVLVDGRARAKSHRLEGGEEILVELPEE